jgi:peptidoglycan/xylan/chitin deacetylase (PgdA/CDA1 family)
MAAALLCLALAACGGAAGQSPSASDVESSNAETSPVSAPEPAATASPSPSGSPAPMPSPDCSVLKCIALTYDDGPDPTTTPQLLDVLGRENVTATMFLIGKNAQAHPELVIRERDLGLQIGNHTMTHPTLSKQPAEVVTDELTQTQTVLSTITGVTPTVMRPPYAARNATTDEISGQLGLAVVTWDSSPVDWENKDASTIHALTVQGASPGAIILMHDTHQWTVDAAAPIIADLKAQGYTFVTVSQLLGATTPGQLYPSH